MSHRDRDSRDGYGRDSRDGYGRDSRDSGRDSGRENTICRIFVGNLPDGVRESEVERLFDKASVDPCAPARPLAARGHGSGQHGKAEAPRDPGAIARPGWPADGLQP
jgi:hypothetical protein